MAGQDDRQRIRELRRAIRRHDRLYYVEARPELTDREYDELYDELVALEAAHPDGITPDSPTQRVGGAPLAGFEHVRHEVPMLSLEKAKDRRELQLFEARVRKELGDEPVAYHVEPKIDGVSIALVYRDGLLTRAATRGDGTTGDDVTANVRTIASVPLRLHGDTPPALLEARGEIYMAVDAFARFNAQLRERGEDPFPNARNATAGSLKQLDPRAVARRPLSAVFYAVARCEGRRFATHEEALRALGELGLPVPRPTWVCGGVEDALARAEDLKAAEKDLPYEIDGAVIKVNDLAQWDRLGVKARHPAYAIAYKPRAWLNQAVTVLRGVTVQVGRTGALTPVAELEPVFLDGSTISRATLHNFEEVARKDIRVGDTVRVEKAGMVIPAVVAVVTERRTGRERPVAEPAACPACGSPVSRQQTAAGGALEVALRCDHLQCPAQKTRRLAFFAQRAALDIEGLGGVVADRLVETGLVDDPLDLFELEEQRLAALNLGTPEEPRVFGAKNAARVTAALARSRALPLHRWLYALAVPNVGEATAFQLASLHGDLRALAGSEILRDLVRLHEARAEALLANPRSRARPPSGEKDRAARQARYDALKRTIASLEARLASFDLREIGPVVARSVLNYFSSPKGAAVLARMKALGLHPRGGAGRDGAGGGPLAGRTVVLTGTLSGMTRDEAARAVREAGGAASGTVSGKTGCVVAGEAPGAAKIGKARKLGIAVIDEAAFLALLGVKPPAAARHGDDLFPPDGDGKER